MQRRPLEIGIVGGGVTSLLLSLFFAQKGFSVHHFLLFFDPDLFPRPFPPVDSPFFREIFRPFPPWAKKDLKFSPLTGKVVHPVKRRVVLSEGGDAWAFYPPPGGKGEVLLDRSCEGDFSTLGEVLSELVRVYGVGWSFLPFPLSFSFRFFSPTLSPLPPKDLYIFLLPPPEKIYFFPTFPSYLPPWGVEDGYSYFCSKEGYLFVTGKGEEELIDFFQPSPVFHGEIPPFYLPRNYFPLLPFWKKRFPSFVIPEREKGGVAYGEWFVRVVQRVLR